MLHNAIFVMRIFEAEFDLNFLFRLDIYIPATIVMKKNEWKVNEDFLTTLTFVICICELFLPKSNIANYIRRWQLLLDRLGNKEWIQIIQKGINRRGVLADNLRWI